MKTGEKKFDELEELVLELDMARIIFAKEEEARIVVSMKDITERKRAEEALRISLEKYRVLFESFPLGITISDKSGKVIEGNRQSEQLLGITREAHAQRRIDSKEWQIIRKDGTPMPADEYASTRALRENRLIENVEMGIVKDKGEITWISVTAAPIPLEGYGVAIAYSDITERKQTEERIHASLREKEILLREVHHRVKNNMQVISGLLDFQARSSRNPELTGMLNESQSRIRSMALIHEKLYESKDFARINLAGYVRTLSQELFQSHKIKSGKIDLIVQTDGDVYVDINKAIPCGLILNELISNALKHAFPIDRQGILQIIIHETKNTEIEIVIRDNGFGLPDDVDIHQPRTVGLYLVNGLVKNQLDGQIEVRRDNGTEFRIKFPLWFERGGRYEQ